MPFINFKTNVKIANKAEFIVGLQNCILEIPNKSIDRTMIQVEDERFMFYKGNDLPCAMVETLVNGGSDLSTVSQYGKKVVDYVSSQLGIDEKRIYVPVNIESEWFSIK